MLIVAGIIRIDPAQWPMLEAAFDKMREATLREPGCLEYQAYVDRKDKGTVLLLEKWKDDAALQAHFVTPHMAEFGKAIGGAGVVGTDVWKYEVSGETKLM
jgi:quinol monooxygenase YgiN